MIAAVVLVLKAIGSRVGGALTVDEIRTKTPQIVRTLGPEIAWQAAIGLGVVGFLLLVVHRRPVVGGAFGQDGVDFPVAVGFGRALL